MSDCIFCQISNDDVPSEQIYSDDKAIAFLDVNPLTKGHTMVIPRRHVKTVDQLSDEEAADLMPIVKRVIEMIKKTLAPDGFTIGINHNVGQAVPHLHIHVIPRWYDDGGGDIHAIVKNPPTESVQSTAAKIREAAQGSIDKIN